MSQDESRNISALDSQQNTQDQLNDYERQLAALPVDASELDRANIKLDIASALLAMERKEPAWTEARECLDIFLANQDWQLAVECCNVMYQCDQPASISVLGQGTWLAITFPIEVGTTIAMLQHIIEETPPNADGAAVAAVAAHYVASMRSPADKLDSYTFLTRNLISSVAERHSQVGNQQELDSWMERLQLKEPASFLPKLALVLNAMVGEEWWFDRDELRKKIPD